MRTIWTSGELAAPAPAVWEVLIDFDAWPRWGPSVRSAEVDGGELRAGARGTVRTAAGVALPFEITAFEPGARWAWKVGGIDATDHRVEVLGPERCRLSFGIAWPAAPYLAVCRVAIGRIGDLVSG